MDRTFALKRLLRDFKEVVQHPLDNIVAYPLDDNIFVWHGNVKASEGVLAGIPIHFALLFPAEYPAQAPEVRLYHAVPHPNVMIAPERNRAPGSKWRLALWDCVPSFDGWSCTYTVLSTLIQMQAFLLDEDLQFDTRKASAAAVAESALELDLWPAYPHTGMSPWPAFPTREQIVNAPRWRLKSITRPPVLAPYRIPGHVSQPLLKNAPPPAALSVASATCSPSAASSSARREPEDPDDGWMEIQKKRKTLPPSSDKTASHVAVASAYSSSPPSMEHSNAFSLLSKLSLDASSAPSYGKQVAATGKTAGLKGANATDGGTGPNNNGLTHAKGKSAANGFGAAVNSANKSASAAGAAKASTSAAAGSQGNKKAGVAPQPAAEPVAVPPQPVEGLWDAGNQAAAGPVLGPNGKPLSASALKRFKKAQRKAAAAGPSAPATAAGVASTPCAASAASAPLCSEPEADSADMQQDISTNGDDEAESAKDADAAEEGDDAAVDGDLVESLDTSRPAADLVRKVLRAVKAERQAAETSGPGVAIETSAVLAAGAGASRAAMGLFGTLSQDILALIMARLQPREVAALGATCRGLHASAQDGLVWKTHLQRCFPNDALPAKAFGTWRQTFLLEANHAAEQLRCSVTKLSHKHAVLGLPIRWTTNPVTKKVDYIEASPELMSTAAFDHGIRKGVMNEDVQAVLPIYIDRDHFQRALPHLDALSRVLAPELCVNGARPPPTAWIDIIPRAMNTAVVLLATEGVTNSDRATTVFCHLHRLLLALAEHFNLWGAAASRIHTFLADPDKRVKEHTPNLGWLLPLLTLAPKYTLRTILPAVLDEAFDRSILWLCKFEGNTSGVSMEAALQRAAPASDPALVSTSLQAARTANRLLMFHAAFLRLVARPEGKDLAAIMHAYDSLLGVPSHFVCERVRTAVAAIMAVDSYAKFFGFLGIRYLGDEWLTRKLRDAWKGSLRKGYHRRKMDFSKIHRSGVSRILLKGNQYSAPPNLKSVEVTEHWRWDSNGGMVYLDASCIAVKVDMTSGTVQRSVQGYVDYSRTSSGFTRVQGAMQHSGDVIDHGNSTGLHTISINLAGLGFEIDELYLTATAFAGKKVCDTVQPFVTIVDPDSGMELCGCIFEDLLRDKKGANSAVVLCKLYRGNGRWHVAKIGDIGDGSADNMGPLFELIHPGMRVPRNVRNRF